jgi:3-oxoacyl-[acyl-carrier protein] reductase
MTPNGKVAVVTGASRGIGRAAAIRLAADGFSVVVGYGRERAKADETKATIAGGGGNAIAVAADVASAPDVARLFERAKAQFDRVDVVVHCAGVMPLSLIAKGDVEAFDRTIATNLRGTFLVFSEAARHVADGGRIMAFSSSIIAKSFPTYGAYIASKAGVEGLVHVLANELRGRDITVNAIAPGPVETDMFLTGKTAEQIAQLAKLAPLERIGRTSDIANLVSFLAGPAGGWINSQVIRANGGYA